MWRRDQTICREFQGQTEPQEKKIELQLLEKMLEPGRVHYQEGGEEQHLTLVPGLGRKSRVQSAVIEEGSLKLELLKFSV